VVTTLDFTVRSDASGFVVSLASGKERASAPFQFDVRPDSRVGRVIADLSRYAVEVHQLRDVGTHLFLGLINGPVETLFGCLREEFEANAAAINDPDPFVLRLTVPAELQHLPWETLYDERRKGFLLTDPRYSLVRAVPEFTTPPRPAPAQNPMSVLVVIPDGSNLDVDRELAMLRGAFEALGDSVRIEVLRGLVTPDALRNRLDNARHDIVHFIGHGDVSDGVARIRFNDPERNPEGLWLSGETFATFFVHHVPRLVVLNSCLGLSPQAGPSLSGIAPFLVRQGIPTTVAMQFEIPDNVAISFTRALYGELFSPRARGRIDLAVAEARRVVYQNANNPPHSFSMPVLYRGDGFETLFEVMPVRTPIGSASGHIAPAPTALPDDLLAALRDRRCVLVLSPEILRIGVTRGAAVPPGPRELAYLLATQSKYPRMSDFDEAMTRASSPDWPLPAVCQHFERPNQRWKLLDAVYRAYCGAAATPGLDAIAHLDVPGVICTHFDGLLEDGLNARRVKFRSIAGVSANVAPCAADETLVVHLRGSVKQPETLVLTESDHEALLEGMRDMCSQITDLTRRTIGRSLLYVGLHPRDPVVRRLTLALRGSPELQAKSPQGPLFFAYTGDTSVDDAYWLRYNVTWIPMETEALVAALSTASAAGVRR
jgi:hypothetical protein